MPVCLEGLQIAREVFEKETAQPPRID